MKEVTIPKKLAPLVKAFSADEKSARVLIIEAVKAIYSSEESKGFDVFETRTVTNDEIEYIVALMKGMQPKDTIEMIYAAQIISSHLIGLKMLSHEFYGDKVLGLKLMKFSIDAMGQLQKKRAGGTNQNITVNYNYNGQGPALMQTVIPSKDLACQ